MRHVIRVCYPSYRSRMLRKVRHKDRQIERMIKRGYPLGFIAEKTGEDIEYIEIVKEVIKNEYKGGKKMQYKTEIGYLQRKIVAALAKKLENHGIVRTDKIKAETIHNTERSFFPNVGITFVSNCDEEGRKIVDRYFEGWLAPFTWKKEDI